MADIVIGSGPSGVAVATALLARGRSVLMLDGGERLAESADERRATLAKREPGAWSDADVEAWQRPQRETPPGQVRRYGSDFAMVPADETFEDAGGVALRASHATGGLSNLWGSAVLPYSPHDMRGWPVTPDEMAPHYRAVAGFVPIAGQQDNLEDLFPDLPMAGRTPLEPSPQGKALFDRLSRLQPAHGVLFGRSRQAVAAGCRLCRQCLHGCPWELIWSARGAIPSLSTNPNFTFSPGAVVERIAETEGGVEVTLRSGQSLSGERLFIGAGVLETARIMLASRDGSASITLRDSQQAFLPMLHRWSTGVRPDKTPLHTLGQIFGELNDPTISPWLVHAQVYTWNEFYLPDLLASYGRLPFAKAVFGALSRRLIVAQCFLHSDHSAKIHLRLGPSGKLVASAEQNPETQAVLSRAIKAFASEFRRAGLVPLTFAARPGAPGSSFHVGASIPMSKTPGPSQSDLLGRPSGFSRVHIVDASTLPAIPATTITLGVMAHAHRIGSLVP